MTDPTRARYLQWLFFSPSCIEPALIQIFTKLEVPASTAAWGTASQVFDVLDAGLQKGPWILGDQFSEADIMIGSGLNFAVRLFKMVPSRPTQARRSGTLADDSQASTSRLDQGPVSEISIANSCKPKPPSLYVNPGAADWRFLPCVDCNVSVNERIN